MRPLLMHRDRSFDAKASLPDNADDLTRDLALDTLLGAMAAGDDFLAGIARTAVLGGIGNEPETIRYRQDVLRDCISNAVLVREMYALTEDALEARRRHFYGGFLSHHPGSVLSGAIRILEVLFVRLKRFRSIAEDQGARFGSEGFRAFFETLRRELNDAYLGQVEEQLRELRFRRGVLVSARLGHHGEGTDYTLRLRRDKGPGWLERLLRRSPPAYTFRIHPRDTAGGLALTELRNRGINRVANALGQSADHVVAFFECLRAELGFYVACMNLHERLCARGSPICFPAPRPPGSRVQRFRGLYDVCLALTTNDAVVGNALDATGKSLMIITGPNTGGKSTFLRAIGVAQLMLHCGMFVGAEAFDAELCTGLFTHYRREEDATMQRGKFDEELVRMSAIADRIGPDALLLCNESFAATNEREGSEISRQIVSALSERAIRIAFVTHQYTFAHGLFDARHKDAIFLRAERTPKGQRTFRLIEGEPLSTSYGAELYQRIDLHRPIAYRSEGPGDGVPRNRPQPG